MSGPNNRVAELLAKFGSSADLNSRLAARRLRHGRGACTDVCVAVYG